MLQANRFRIYTMELVQVLRCYNLGMIVFLNCNVLIIRIYVVDNAVLVRKYWVLWLKRCLNVANPWFYWR